MIWQLFKSGHDNYSSKAYKIYVDIMTEKNCCQFWLPTFIGQFVHPVEGEGIGIKGVYKGIVILASYKIHFIRVYDNLM